MNPARVLALVGWSGSGKTTLLVKLIPLLIGRGLKVSTLKHAHHEFDVDTPGKDSYAHRRAGAGEVIVSSSRRWVQMHEVGDGPEATLADLLRRLAPCDLILVESFKTEAVPKMEVFRQAAGKRPLHPDDRDVVALASDQLFPEAGIPAADLNDAEAVAEMVLRCARPLEAVLAALEGPPAGGSGL